MVQMKNEMSVYVQFDSYSLINQRYDEQYQLIPLRFQFDLPFEHEDSKMILQTASVYKDLHELYLFEPGDHITAYKFTQEVSQAMRDLYGKRELFAEAKCEAVIGFPVEPPINPCTHPLGLSIVLKVEYTPMFKQTRKFRLAPTPYHLRNLQPF